MAGAQAIATFPLGTIVGFVVGYVDESGEEWTEEIRASGLLAATVRSLTTIPGSVPSAAIDAPRGHGRIFDLARYFSPRSERGKNRQFRLSPAGDTEYLGACYEITYRHGRNKKPHHHYFDQDQPPDIEATPMRGGGTSFHVSGGIFRVTPYGIVG